MSGYNVIETLPPRRAAELIPHEWVIVESQVMRVATCEPASLAAKFTRLTFDHWHGRDDEYPMESRELVVPDDQMIARVHMVRFIA